jgi:hypothetical protein
MSEALLRSIPAIAWCAMVVLGVFFIVASGKPVQTEQTLGAIVGKSLPANYYFAPGDKSLGSAAGRYVASPAGAKVGAVLRGADLSDRPALPLFRSPTFLVSAPISPAAIGGGLNAGSEARLCGKGAASYGSATVRYVACDDNGGFANFCAAVAEIKDAATLDSLAKAAQDPVASGDIRIAEACK